MSANGEKRDNITVSWQAEHRQKLQIRLLNVKSVLHCFHSCYPGIAR